MNKIKNRTGAAPMLFALCLCACPNRSPAEPVYEPYTLTNFAGSFGQPGYSDGTGSAARLYKPSGVAVDASGNVYVADTYNSTIRKITPAGVVTTLAGLAGRLGSADGTGSAARFNYPWGIATDASGNVYTAEFFNYTIRKITPAGEVSTLAGMAGTFGDADGTGSAARFFRPLGIATDVSGNVYVADTYNNTVRKCLSWEHNPTRLPARWDMVAFRHVIQMPEASGDFVLPAVVTP